MGASKNGIYEEAFEGHGAKPVSIIQNMFARHLCDLHVMKDGKDAVAMALTGARKNTKVVVIDYLAVKKDYRQQDLGIELFSCIKKWALSQQKYSLILLEAECDSTPESLARVSFWKKCGFILLDDYVHH